MIGEFQSTFSVSVFHRSLVGVVFMIDGSKNLLVSWVLNFIVCVLLKGAIKSQSGIVAQHMLELWCLMSEDGRFVFKVMLGLP